MTPASSAFAKVGSSTLAESTWTCDISDAERGEGRRLATVWPEVRLPPDLATEEGPDPRHTFIRAVRLEDLAAAVARSLQAEPDREPR